MRKILDLNDDLPYGKYKGRIIKEIIEEDVEYLLWFGGTLKIYKYSPSVQHKILTKSTNK